MRVLAAVAAVLVLGTAAAAEEPEPAPTADWLKPLRLRGRVSEEFAYRLHDPGDVSKLRTTGWLDGKYKFSESVTLRAAVRGWYDAVFDVTDRYPANVVRDEQTELALREAVLSVSKGDLDVRVGRQQIVWGEAIGTFITDVVNPRDFREFVLPEFSEIRLPIWALDFTYRLREGLSFEGVWTPDTRPNKLPKQGAEFQFDPPSLRLRNPVVRLPDNPDEFSLARSEGGFRLSALVRGWDMSLIYYDEADKFPVIFQRRASQPPPRPDIIVLEPQHPRLHIVGGTLAKSIEPVVLRGEVAYTIGKRFQTIDPRDADGVVRRDTLDYLIGIDYTFFSRLDAAVQLSQKILVGSATGVVSSGVEGQVTTAVTVRLTTGFFDNTLNPGVLFAVQTNRGDYRLSPRIDYLVGGALTISIGADVFEGPKHTLYGQFDRSDRVWVTTTWRF